MRSTASPIAQAIALGTLRVGDIVRSDAPPRSVSLTASVVDVHAVAASSGHLRILVGTGPDCGVVHVRDTLAVDPAKEAAAIARKPMVATTQESAYDALSRMRRGRAQLAIVVDDGRLVGVVTLDDLLREVLSGPGALESYA